MQDINGLLKGGAEAKILKVCKLQLYNELQGSKRKSHLFGEGGSAKSLHPESQKVMGGESESDDSLK